MLQKDSPPKYPFLMGKYSLTQLMASFWYHRAFLFEGTLGGLWGWITCNIARIAPPVILVPPLKGKLWSSQCFG